MSTSRNEKVVFILGILLLLWLLFRNKSSLPGGDSKSFLIDPSSGLKVGYGGVSKDSNSIGEVVLPPGIANDVGTSAFQYAVQNSPLPLCPTGYEAVIDPDAGKAYCLLSGYGNVPSQNVIGV